MINSWKAYIECCQAVPELEDLTNPRATAQSAATPFHYLPETFDREIYQLKLPSFLQPHASTMYDAKPPQRFGFGRNKDPHQRRAELHLFYLKFPSLCKQCECPEQSSCTCLNYAQLWDRFLEFYLAGDFSAPAASCHR